MVTMMVYGLQTIILITIIITIITITGTDHQGEARIAVPQEQMVLTRKISKGIPMQIL